MDEINIVAPMSAAREIAALSESERMDFFRQMSASDRSLTPAQYDDFAFMISEYNDFLTLQEKPTILELLLRIVIKLSIGIGSEYNSLIIPITPALHAPTIKRRETAVEEDNIEEAEDAEEAVKTAEDPDAIDSADEDDAVAAATKARKKGGAAPIWRRLKKLPTDVKHAIPDHAIKIRFDTRILTKSEDNIYYMANPDEELIVTGLEITPHCKINPATFPTLYLPHNISLERAIMPIDMVRSCADIFDGPRRGIKLARADKNSENAADNEVLINETTTIMFQQHNKPEHLFEQLRVYLANLRRYFDSSHSAAYVFAQLSNFTMINQRKHAALTLPKKTILPAIKPPELLSKIENFISENTGVRLAPYSRLNVLGSLYVHGLLPMYYHALKNGTNNAEMADMIVMRKKHISHNRAFANIRKAALDRHNKMLDYKNIVARLLGARKLELAMKSGLDGLLDALAPADRKVVENEYARQQKHLAALATNTCKHISIYNRLRGTVSERQLGNLYTQLQPFYAAKNKDQIIKCATCGFDLICPHVDEMIRLDIAAAPHNATREALVKYIDAVNKNYTFCKICGESISDELFDADEMPKENESNMNEELKNFIWGEVASTVRYLRFAKMINTNRFITAIRNAIYPFIFDIEFQLLRSKTNTVDEIRAKKRVYTSIYAFAYLIKLVVANKEITIRDLNIRNKKQEIAEMIMWAINTINSSKNTSIREIQGMTIETIKERVIDAYKHISRENKDAGKDIEYTSEQEDIFMFVLADPIYQYIFRMTMIQTGGRALVKENPISMFNFILGKDVKQLEKAPYLYDSVKWPKLNEKQEDEFLRLKETGDIAKRFPATVRNGAIIAAFNTFAEQISSKLYEKPVYKSSAGSAIFSTAFSAYHNQCARINEAFAHIRENHLFKNAPLYLHPQHPSRQWKILPEKIGRLYDEKGNHHKFNIYVCAGKFGEMTARDMAAVFESGGSAEWDVIDTKCSICGVLASDAAKLNEGKIRASLDTINGINNLFRFYENRCPAEGLHEINDVGDCKKCKFKVAMLINNKNAESIEFYNKWRDTYTRELKEYAIDEVVSAPKLPPKTKFSDDYTTWTPNFSSVISLATKLNINQRLITALGSFDYQDYNDILSGTYIPAEAVDHDDSRIYVLVSHIRNLIVHYNQLRFFHRLYKPPADIAALIDTSGINKYKISELAAKLPEIYGNFNDKFDFMRQNKKPREIVSFCIQTLCEMCLLIYDHSLTETEKIRRLFVQFYMRKILRDEELLTKAGNFNWAIIYGDKNAVDAGETTGESTDDITDDPVLEKEQEKEVDAPADAPFSFDAYDVEEDEDADPEESAVIVRFDEGGVMD